jgi:hypothetical protein
MGSWELNLTYIVKNRKTFEDVEHRGRLQAHLE